MKPIPFTLAALTAILMSGAALAQTELRITHSMTGGGNKVALDAIIADFEAAYPDIKVKQIVFDDDLYSDTGLITQLKSNEVPDIYFQWAGFPVQRDAEAGYAMDLTEALASDGWGDTFSPSLWTEGAGTMAGGKPYLVPGSIDLTNTIWYNSTIFEENGLAAPKTWTEFTDLIKVLVAAGETPIVEGNNELWPLGNWASHVAAKVVPVEEYEAAFERTGKFSTPGFEKALGLLAELHEIGAFNRDMAGLGADPAMATFFQEAAVMHPIGSWLIGSAGDLAEDEFTYDQFDTPVIDDTHPLKDSVIGTTTGFVIHAKSPNQDAAVQFLKFFTSEAEQIKWAEGGSLSPIEGVNEKANLDPHTKSVAELIENASAMVPPPDNKYPVPVAEAYYQAAAFAAGGEKTPTEALAWLDETIAAMGAQ